MGLRDLKTRLKDVGYGGARKPYVTKKPPGDGGFNPVDPDIDNLTQGLVGQTQAVTDDLVRTTQWLASPKGLEFTLKQAGLQRMQPVQEGTTEGDRYYTPANLLAQIAGNAAGLHFVRHGLKPTLTESGYAGAMNEQLDQNDASANRLVKQLATIINRPDNRDIVRYNGGPGSFYGLGQTVIRRSVITQTAPNLLTAEQPYLPLMQEQVWSELEGRKPPLLVAAEALRSGSYTPASPRQQPIINRAASPDERDDSAISPYMAKAGLNTVEYRYRIGEPYSVVRPSVPRSPADKGIGELAPFYTDNLRQPGKKSLLLAQTEGQEVTLLDAPEQIQPRMADMVPFRVELIDNDNPAYGTFLVFRTTNLQFSDSYNSDWDSVNYNGRGEPFYVYRQTGRQVSFSFRIAGETKDGMRAAYQKLNSLAAAMYPEYKGLRMRGSLVRLTLGDYLTFQPGILTSLTLTPLDEAPWDMNPGSYKLPMVIDVSASFTPIHNFLPQRSLYRTKLVLPVHDPQQWLFPLEKLEKREVGQPLQIQTVQQPARLSTGGKSTENAQQYRDKTRPERLTPYKQ